MGKDPRRSMARGISPLKKKRKKKQSQKLKTNVKLEIIPSALTDAKGSMNRKMEKKYQMVTDGGREI